MMIVKEEDNYPAKIGEAVMVEIDGKQFPAVVTSLGAGVCKECILFYYPCHRWFEGEVCVKLLEEDIE